MGVQLVISHLVMECFAWALTLLRLSTFSGGLSNGLSRRDLIPHFGGVRDEQIDYLDLRLGA